ncbi:MAG: hypothetical protein FWD28_02910 [Treponema sp.]|nr:hypothetical protein [Treponema sp.]
MRVFLCSYTGFSLAIPMDSVSSIFVNNDRIDDVVHYNNENRNTYICLPILFNCPALLIKHGIILKNGTDNNTEDSIVLLSSEINNEDFIPLERFYPVPKTLRVLQFAGLFNGLTFFSHSNSGELILLLNPEQLGKYIKKENI